MNFPFDLTPSNKHERQIIDEQAIRERDEAEAMFADAVNRNDEFLIPNVQKLPLDVYLISQKHSPSYSSIPYGLYSDIASAGCGPLALEYALRLLGYNVSFEELVEECVKKGYRGYVYDENDKIIDGSGTKYSLFSNLAEEVKSFEAFIDYIERGLPITCLVKNSVYRGPGYKLNHFITIMGCDGENFVLMDGNKIVASNNEALIKFPFWKLVPGFRGAWVWKKEKVASFMD